MKQVLQQIESEMRGPVECEYCGRTLRRPVDVLNHQMWRTCQTSRCRLCGGDELDSWHKFRFANLRPHLIEWVGRISGNPFGNQNFARIGPKIGPKIGPANKTIAKKPKPVAKPNEWLQDQIIDHDPDTSRPIYSNRIQLNRVITV